MTFPAPATAQPLVLPFGDVDGQGRVVTVNGGQAIPVGSVSRRRLPTGGVAESFSRLGSSITTVTPSGVNQRALGALVDLSNGVAVSALHFLVGDTGNTAGQLTNLFAVLLDANRTVLAVGTDIGGAGVTTAANQQIDLPISYTPGADMAAYAMVACNGSIASYMGVTVARSVVGGLAPIAHGVSSTVISGGPGTVAVGSTLGALTVSAGVPYLWLT